MEKLSVCHLEKYIAPIAEQAFPSAHYEYTFKKDPQAVQLTISDDRREWFRFKLRDRVNDGPDWQPTPLCQWPNTHADDIFPFGRAAEQSKYWQDPNYPLTNRYNPELTRFVENPWQELPFENPTRGNILEWFEKWQEITREPRPVYPGAFSLKSLPELTAPIFQATNQLLRESDYDFLTSVPTWYHIAQINTCRLGFKYVYTEDQARVAQLSQRLPQETSEQRVQASWAVVLQFWNSLVEDQDEKPEDLVHRDLVLRDCDGSLLTYPLSPQRNLWLARRVA